MKTIKVSGSDLALYLVTAGKAFACPPSPYMVVDRHDLACESMRDAQRYMREACLKNAENAFVADELGWL